MFIYKYCSKCNRRNHKFKNHCVRCGDELTTAEKFGKNVFAVTLSIVILFFAVTAFAGKSYLSYKANNTEQEQPKVETKTPEATSQPTTTAPPATTTAPTTDKSPTTNNSDLMSCKINGIDYGKVTKSKCDQLLEESGEKSKQDSINAQRNSLKSQITYQETEMAKEKTAYNRYVNRKQDCMANIKTPADFERCHQLNDSIIAFYAQRIKERDDEINALYAELRAIGI